MRCGDVRWRLRPFLDGILTDSQAEAVREHLDSCPDCVNYLVTSNMIDRLEVDSGRQLPIEVAGRLAAEVAAFDSGPTLSRWLYYIFGAASLLGITVFAFVRHYLSPTTLRELDESLAGHETFTTLFPWLEQWISSSAFTYVLLSLGAVLLSVVLVVSVDLIQQLAPRQKGAR
jgi:hypothetical protein